jgi:hypothetical protein
MAFVFIHFVDAFDQHILKLSARHWSVHRTVLLVLRTSVLSLASSDVRVISLDVSGANTLPDPMQLTNAQLFRYAR